MTFRTRNVAEIVDIAPQGLKSYLNDQLPSSFPYSMQTSLLNQRQSIVPIAIGYHIQFEELLIFNCNQDNAMYLISTEIEFIFKVHKQHRF